MMQPMPLSATYHSSDEVYVNWLESPSYFFVSRCKDEPLQIYIRDLILDLHLKNELEAPRPPLPKSPNDTGNTDISADWEVVGLDLGQMVLASSRARRNDPFLRAVILAGYEDQVLGLHFKVQYVDVGHEQWVHLDDLRLVPSSLKSIPPLAEQCTLYGVRPMGNVWSQEAIDTFEMLVENDTICALEKLPGSTTNSSKVDLLSFANGRHNEPVSVRYHLIFTMHAKLSNGATKNSIVKIGLLPVSHLSKGCLEKVYISYVDNSMEMYVQPVSLVGQNGSWLQELDGQMKDHCESSPPVAEHELYRGQLCIVHDEQSGNFMRGIVEDVSDNQVDIFCVDMGSRQVTSPDKIWLLESEEKFILEHPYRMAVNVTLDGGTQVNTQESVEQLQSFITKPLVMYVAEELEDQLSIILLHQKDDKCLVCLNNCLTTPQTNSNCRICGTLEHLIDSINEMFDDPKC